jgi:hypothetical protein
MDTVLAAIFCTAVSLVVGVVIGGILPEHHHQMELGSAAEWLGGIGAVATAVIAWIALRSWRDQVRGQSSHAAAAEIAEAARLLKYHFYDARNPFWSATEFPPAYRTAPTPRPNPIEVMGWGHVFTNRFQLLNGQILRLATLRAKAGALLSEESADALEALARKARELENFFRERLEQIRVGPHIVSQWPDQKWVQLVNQSFECSSERNDAYSLELEERYRNLKGLVDPFI